MCYVLKEKKERQNSLFSKFVALNGALNLPVLCVLTFSQGWHMLRLQLSAGVRIPCDDAMKLQGATHDMKQMFGSNASYFEKHWLWSHMDLASDCSSAIY